jgi:hypothetical protein
MFSTETKPVKPKSASNFLRMQKVKRKGLLAQKNIADLYASIIYNLFTYFEVGSVRARLRSASTFAHSPMMFYLGSTTITSIKLRSISVGRRITYTRNNPIGRLFNNYYTVHMCIKHNRTYKMLLYFNISFLDDALIIR